MSGPDELMPGPGELVAVSRPLPRTPDLIQMGAAEGGVLWASEELALAGQGVALRLAYGSPDGEGPDGEGPDGKSRGGRAAQVVAALAAIEHRDPAATGALGPVALGALPFHPDGASHLVVPRRLVGRRGDRVWVTEIRPRSGDWPEDPSGAAGAAAPPEQGKADGSPDEFSLVPSQSHRAWKQTIAEAVERIRGGELAKVVLARRVDVVANRPFVLAEVVARLTALYPTCMVFHLDGFIGASPELLVRRQGRAVSSRPLAGTVARSGDRAADDALVAALLASTKERFEHRIVIDHLAEVLAPWCETLEVPPTPAVIGLRNVSHLATLIEGRLAERATGLPSALELVAALHPTAAVGGWPTAEALAYLEKVEGFDRGRYAGPVGWVDAHGDGAWALAIRSAQVDGCRASMYAGVGVVADSEPDAELAETQLKLQALLAALVRP